jgi:hypothetical protein
MEWTTVIITNIVQPSKTAFGVREDNGESVFIPPSVSKTLGLEVSDIALAKLVPNNDQSSRVGSRPPVPWFAPLMARSIDDVMDPDEVKDLLEEHEYPVTAEEAGIPSVALQQAYQAGKIMKIVVMPSPRDERIIMWAADMDRV